MEKLMFKYLNESHTSAYILRTKFGDLLYDNQGSDFAITRQVPLKGTIVNQLKTLFSCDESYATNVFNNWKASLHVYVMIMNATNDSVIVPLETECNSTSI
jgi:hypothetical protein